MKEVCSLCSHFEGISNNVGYCTFIGVMIEKGVAIVDAHSTLELIKDRSSIDQEIYNYIVVQSTFGCIHFKRMVMH